MADKKISQLTGATTPLTGTEELAIVQGGSTVKATAQDVADLAGGIIVEGAGTNSTLRVGLSNSAGGTSSTCLGDSNSASGNYSTIGGGILNTASGAFSGILGGSGGVANRHGQRSWANGAFFDAGDSQQIDLVARTKTTTATPTNLWLNGSNARITISSGFTLFATVNVAGIKSDGSSAAHYIRKVAIKNVGGTTSLIGTVSTIGTDVEDNAGYDVTITADNTNDALDIKVTGATGETIRWTAHIQGVEIKYGT